MATTRPYAINTGTTISGTTQVGNIAIGVAEQDYSANPGGVTWYMGPDEEIGHVICLPSGEPLQFWRASGFTNESFVTIVNNAASRQPSYTGFTNTIVAKTWLTGQTLGYTTFVTPTFTSEAIDLIDRMDVAPSDGLKELINVTVKALVDNDIFYDYADCLYLPCMHTAQASMLNWINSGHTLTLYNSPRWMKGMGVETLSGAYIGTGFVPSTDAIHYSLYDVGVGYGSFKKTGSGQYVIYAASVNVDGLQLYMNPPTITYRGKIHNPTRSSMLTTNYTITTLGFNEFERISSSAVSVYYNGVIKVNGYSQSGTTALPDSQIIFNYEISSQVGFGFNCGYIGKSLGSKNAVFYDIISNFVNKAGQCRYGAEMVNQSEWYTAAYWNTVFTSWSQDGTYLYSNGGSGEALRSSFYTAGKTYKITTSVIVISGSVRIGWDGTTSWQDIGVTGQYVHYTYVPGNYWLDIKASSFVGWITSLSIQEVELFYYI